MNWSETAIRKVAGRVLGGINGQQIQEYGDIIPAGSIIPYLDPRKYAIYFNDFICARDYDATNDWTLTVEQGTGAAALKRDTANSYLELLNSGADDDALSLQLYKAANDVGLIFRPVGAKRTYFEALVRLSNATQCDALVGLVINDPTLAGGALPQTSYYAAFVKDDGDTNWDFVAANGAAETEEAAIATADTGWVRLSFVIDGTYRILPYVDGVAKTPLTSGLPAGSSLAITAAIVNGDGNARSLQMDYVVAAQER